MHPTEPSACGAQWSWHQRSHDHAEPISLVHHLYAQQPEGPLPHQSLLLDVSGLLFSVLHGLCGRGCFPGRSPGGEALRVCVCVCVLMHPTMTKLLRPTLGRRSESCTTRESSSVAGAWPCTRCHARATRSSSSDLYRGSGKSPLAGRSVRSHVHSTGPSRSTSADSSSTASA